MRGPAPRVVQALRVRRGVLAREGDEWETRSRKGEAEAKEKRREKDQ